MGSLQGTLDEVASVLCILPVLADSDVHGQRNLERRRVLHAVLHDCRHLVGPLPPFYGDRLITSEQRAVHGTFDDFVASVGGGTEYFFHAHWAVRPDVRVMMVFGNSDVRWVTAFGGPVAYHFERHRESE